MILFNAEYAFIDKEKFFGYILSEHHLEGKHKARVFNSVAGITAENGATLIDAITEAILMHDAVFEKQLTFGGYLASGFSLPGKGEGGSYSYSLDFS